MPSTWAEHPKTHFDVLHNYQYTYNTGVQNGTILPCSWPLGSYGSLILLIYLMIPPRHRLEMALTRYMTFGLICFCHGCMILYSKAYTMASGFGIGIIYGWGLIWAATLLIFARPKLDFQRIQRRGQRGRAEAAIEKTHKHDHGASKPSESTGNDIQHQVPNAEALSIGKKASSLSKLPSGTSQTSLRPVSGTCVWQTYPLTSFIERLDWVLDLGSNFRGVGWNWRISGLPSLPASVQRELSGVEDKGIKDYARSRTGLRRFDVRSELKRRNLWYFASGYLAIDLIVTMSHHDPYFWGLFGKPPPAYLPFFLQESDAFLRCYRSLATMTIVWVALRTIFALGPLFFAVVLGPERIGVRGESWFYPDHYGTYGNICDRGLAGWWGGWWHQTFRFGFESGSNWLCDRLGLEQGSLTRKVVQILAAFGLSGCIHASGSYTMPGDTWPLASFLFFFCQPVGLLLEISWRMSLKKTGLAERIPKRIGQAANFVFVHTWFYFTAHLLADDWARGGIWLAQPVPFSVCSALGMGVKGDSFWCWSSLFKGDHAWWHVDESWWKTGIAP